jgi:hypothetical protein
MSYKGRASQATLRALARGAAYPLPLAQPMSIELTILYDGTSEALREHRLSVAEMGKPLQLLLAAIQRTGSSILRQASDDAYGQRGGRFAAAAKRLDIQIGSIEDGCVQLHTSLVQAPIIGESLTIPGLDLPELTLVRVLDDLEAEASGRPRNAAVRRYLRSLPATVTKQSYRAKRNGVVLREATLGAVHTPTEAAKAPRITRVVGTVSAVGLEADHETVTIKGEVRETYAASASLVERALALRAVPVRAVVVAGLGTRGRLVRLDELGADLGGNADARLARLAHRWDEALAALAK